MKKVEGTYYNRNKEICKQKALEYYHNNRLIRNEIQKEYYRNVYYPKRRMDKLEQKKKEILVQYEKQKVPLKVTF